MSVAAVAAVAAFGHIPGVGYGLAPTTNGPDLRSVTIIGTTDGTGTNQARYCFDQLVDDLTAGGAGTPAAFFNIQTYDSLRAMSPDSVVKAADPNCVDATFPDALDLPQGTIGSMRPGAVTDRNQRLNDFASEPLTGSVVSASAGATTGPDLSGVTTILGTPANKRAIYTFDENLNPTPANPYNPAQFRFFRGNGSAVGGSSVVVTGNRATVGFGSDPDINGASRFDVTSGAVQDRPQSAVLPGLPIGSETSTSSSPGVKLVAGGTESSATPQVVAAAVDGPTSFKVSFSEAVLSSAGNSDGTRFFAVLDDGLAFVGQPALSLGGDPNSVIVNFPPAAGFSSSGIVKILALPGAVRAVDDGGLNFASEAAVGDGAPSVPGLTNGPDLLRVRIDAPTSRVTFVYDESVDPNVTPPQGGFQAITVDRAPINPNADPQVNNNEVSVGFPSAVVDAVAYSNSYGAVRDRSGRANPHQSVSKDILLGALPPPPPPPPPGVVVPPGVRAPAVVPKFKTRVTIRRRGRVYSGQLRSSRKACIQGRRVVLKKRGKDARYGQRKSSRRGKYSIRRRTRIRGRVYAVVTARKTSSVNCLSGKSKQIRG